MSAVSLPPYRRRYLINRRQRLAWPEPSWLPGVHSFRARLPIGHDPRRSDVLGAWRLGRALGHVTPGTRNSRLVIATHPVWAPVALAIPALRRTFDAYDDWRARSGSRHLRKQVEAGYNKLRFFDCVTVHTDRWAARLEDEFGISTTTEGNGVELALYAEPHHRPPGLPDGPFAVYLGSIENRVDLTLLERLASDQDQVSVVVAGPADPATSERLRRGPVHWIGPVQPQLVPGLLGAASVGLLPHVDNAFTRSMDPMKVLEYLAAGLRVVATDVAVPTGTEDWIEFAPTHEAFIAAVVRNAKGLRPAPPNGLLAERDWPVVARRLLRVHLGHEMAAP